MKRFTCALLALLMLAGMVVAPTPVAASGAEVTPIATSEICSCGCETKLSEIHWTLWDPNNAVNSVSGHYYLAEDYAQDKPMDVKPNVRIVLDLRGHTLTQAKENIRLFMIYGYVAVIDTVGSGRILTKPGQSGSAAYVRLDTVAMNEALDGTFAIYNCTMAQDAGTKTSSNGGFVFLEDNVNFKAFGARLMSASVTSRGGAIYGGSTSTRIEMTDSSILDCYAASRGGAIYAQGHVTLDGCHLTGNSASYGGNIALESAVSSLTVKNNSIIENGVATSSKYGGGNIYDHSSSTVNISDSTIRNGYTAHYGGNISFGSGEYTLTNTTISGGVAAGDGANLYCNKSAARITIDSCNISGDFTFGSGQLTLKGETKIGMNNNGLKLLNDSTVITANELTDGAEIYMDAQGTFTGTGVNSDYFQPALRTVLSTVNGCLKGTQTNGSVAGCCPHCGQQVAWNAFTGNGATAGHYYLTKDQSITSAYQISADVVLDLDGYDITSTDRVFTVTNSGALTLLDRKGGSLINGSGNTDGLGGVISSTGTLSIYKGSYTYTADEAKPLTNGGVIYATGTVNIHGGFFDGSAFNRTDEGCKGGAIYLAEEAGSFTMSAARIVGGAAYSAGSVYLGANNNVTITGGSITGGTATNTAGNLALAGVSAKRNGTASISGLSLTDGTAQVEGGNFHLAYYKQFPMTDCYFAGGTSQTSKGGNIYFGTCSYTTLTNTILLNGTASTGGNIHNNSNAAVITLVDCLVTNGSANNGGNLYLQNGLITLQGGEYSYGTAFKNGGNINNATGSLDDDCLIIAKNQAGNAPMIVKGTATENGGNIYTNGILTLQAGTFHNGTAASGQDIYHNSGNVSMLNIGADLSGEIRMAVASGNLGDGIFGQPIAKTSATALNAQLVLENLEGMPQACLNDGQLYVSSATVKTADGAEVWYKSNADAMNACPADGWIQLYSTQPLVLTKDCFVDLAGKSVDVSGNHTLYGMDTSGDDYAVSAGKLRLSGGAVAAPATDAPNGNRYIAIADGNDVSYHRLDMQLTTVSIRPSDCGVYYSGTWGCDSVLAGQIESYGIAVSLYNMPDARFEADNTCLYTSYQGDTLTSGETKTGVLIKNIMKDALSPSQNNRRGNMPIYATGYVKLANGAVYTGDKEGAEDDIAFSLRTTMERMDSLIAQDPSLFLSDTVNAARAFRAKWDNLGMENWVFDKLADPQDDGILKIMILGSSRSVNTFRLLYEVFKDQMPEQEIVLGIMYYSGCSMTMHMNFIKDNAYVYDYYCNDSGRWKIMSGVNMDTGLYAHNWDVILLQAGTGDLANQMNLSTRNFLKDYIDDRMLEPYDLWWHSTWFNSTDPELNPNGATVDQVAQLKETNDTARAYVLDDPMFAGHIASGTPVLYAIKELNVPENKLFRDHTHLYDFGCLLVGYSFYAQFTGKPVTQINLDKIPDYLRIREHVALGDVPVTEEDKQIIIDAVAYTMQDPWAVPGAE